MIRFSAMRKIIDRVKSNTREHVDDIPICGEDYCDMCGDCLVCHIDLWCYGTESPEHPWVEYRWEE